MTRIYMMVSFFGGVACLRGCHMLFKTSDNFQHIHNKLKGLRIL